MTKLSVNLRLDLRAETNRMDSNTIQIPKSNTDSFTSKPSQCHSKTKQ